MSVAIVTPWLDHPELWDDYDEALRWSGGYDELILIDNHSDPPLEFATVRVQENLGFAGACNLGLDLADSEFVVFLNNDIQLVRKGWLTEIVETLDANPATLVGAQLRFDRHADLDGINFPYLDGWCLAGLRSDLLELGGFNTDLQEPAYFSDNLLCLEARAAGFTLIEVPGGLYHKLNQTAKRNDPTTRAATLANMAVYQDRARELMVTA